MWVLMCLNILYHLVLEKGTIIIITIKLNMKENQILEGFQAHEYEFSKTYFHKKVIVFITVDKYYFFSLN